jgi:hypothetical protein
VSVVGVDGVRGTVASAAAASWQRDCWYENPPPSPCRHTVRRCRAIDQFGQVIDVFVATRRNATAAHRFLQRAIGTAKVRPAEVVTDRAPVYRSGLEELLPAAWHRTDRYANNRAAGARTS